MLIFHHRPRRRSPHTLHKAIAQGPTGALGEVVVLVGIVLGAFEVLSVDESLDSLFDCTGVGLEKGQLREDLGDELLVLEGLVSLHDTDDGSLDGDGTVLLDALGVVGGIEGGHRDTELAHVAAELGVGLEAVGGVDLVAGRSLGDDLVLAAREGVHERLEDALLEVALLGELGEGEGLAAAEGVEGDGLEGSHLHVVGLLAEGTTDVGISEGVDPRKLALGVLVVMPLLEDAHASGHILGKNDLGALVGGPETGGEDLDGEVELGVALLELGVELGLLVAADGQIGQHTLHLRCEVGTALHLELRDHGLLGIVAGRSLVEQALCKLVAVDLGEQILIGQIREKLDDAFQVLLDLLLGQLLTAALENAITEGGHELGVGELANILVDNLLEGILEGLLEQGMAGELRLDDAEVLLVKLDESLDKLGIVILVLLSFQSSLALVDDLIAHRGDELLHHIGQWGQTLLQPGEEVEHPPEVLELVIGQQDAAS